MRLIHLIKFSLVYLGAIYLQACLINIIMSCNDSQFPRKEKYQQSRKPKEKASDNKQDEATFSKLPSK